LNQDLKLYTTDPAGLLLKIYYELGEMSPMDGSFIAPLVLDLSLQETFKNSQPSGATFSRDDASRLLEYPNSAVSATNYITSIVAGDRTLCSFSCTPKQKNNIPDTNITVKVDSSDFYRKKFVAESLKTAELEKQIHQQQAEIIPEVYAPRDVARLYVNTANDTIQMKPNFEWSNTDFLGFFNKNSEAKSINYKILFCLDVRVDSLRFDAAQNKTVHKYYPVANYTMEIVNNSDDTTKVKTDVWGRAYVFIDNFKNIKSMKFGKGNDIGDYASFGIIENRINQGKYKLPCPGIFDLMLQHPSYSSAPIPEGYARTWIFKYNNTDDAYKIYWKWNQNLAEVIQFFDCVPASLENFPKGELAEMIRKNSAYSVDYNGTAIHSDSLKSGQYYFAPFVVEIPARR